MSMGRPLSVFVNIGAKMLPSLGASASAAEKRMTQMGRKMKLIAAETKVAGREMAAALKPIAAMAAAGGLTMGVSKAIGSGANFMHEVSAMRIAGRSAEEVSKAIAQAHKTVSEVPTSTLTDNLKILRETTGAYGDLHHAMENLSFNQRLGYSMVNIAGMAPDDAMHSLVAGIQALEIRGSAMDPKRYQKEMNSLFQAMSFFAGKEGAFTPASLQAFSKTGNIPLKMMSERFMTRILPAMITEVGSGDLVGTQASAFNNWLNGNTGTGNKSKTEFAQKIGLVTKTDSSQLTKTGWRPGAVAGTALAKTDTFKWVETILLPKLKAAGFNTDDTGSMEIALSSLFGRETAKRYIMGMADPKQRMRLHKDEANVSKAMTSEEGYKFMLANDPTAAWARVMTSIENLTTNLGKHIFTDRFFAAVDKFVALIDRASNYFGGDGTKKNPGHPMAAIGALGTMGGGGVLATATLFGVGFKMAGALAKGLLSGIGRSLVFILGTLPMRLGPLLLNGLIMVGPWIARGLALAFGVLTGPVGWAILAASALALVYAYRDKIAGAWHFVSDWFATSAWPMIQSAASAVFTGMGGGLITALISGLATAWPRLKAWWSEKWGALSGGASSLFGGGAAAPAPVGGGAPPPVTGSAPRPVMPAPSRGGRSSATAAGVSIGNVHIHGANDAESTRRILRSELQRMAGAQSTYLSD